MREVLNIGVCLVHTSILFGVTLFLQIIGYGTAPLVDDKYGLEYISDKELNKLIEIAINDYNTTYYIEIIFISIVVIGLNFIILNKLTSKYILILSFLIFLIYIVASLYSLNICSENYRAAHF